MGRTLLFPTDGSEVSNRAFNHLIDFARTDDVIVVVHVIPNPDEGYLGNTYQSVIADKELRSGAEDLTEAVREDLHEAGFEAEVKILKGHTGRRISEFADETEADAIVIGRTGHGTLAETLLGSVSQYLIHHASVPVIVVP